MTKKLFSKIAVIITIICVSILSLFLLTFFIKGDKGDPLFFQKATEKSTRVGGPFEASNSTARYALTESIVERNTFFFTEAQARFSVPDVSLYNGKFFSTFMPGISFIGVPFYMAGKYLGMPQLLTYLSVTLVGFLNIFLIARIAYKLGANIYASLLAGFLFLFATNALTYSLFYTQHITSVTLLLLSILAVMGKKSILNAILFGSYVGVSLLIDVPNIFLLVPVGIYFLFSYITPHKEHESVKIAFNPRIFAFLLGIVPFILLLGWYNLQTTGSYTKLGQTIGRTSYFEKELITRTKQPADSATLLAFQSELQASKSANLQETSGFKLPFKPRGQMEGFYTLIMSNERAWFYYSPIVLLGIIGFILYYREKKTQPIAVLFISVVLINIVLYSMFGDPWGGWAFGPRYLIPAAALLCVGLAMALQQFKTKTWFIILFISTAIYSLYINSLGAITTSAIPPKVESDNLITPIPYTYKYNIQLMNEERISSLAYNFFFSSVSPWTYLYVLTGVLALIVLVLYIFAMFERKKANND